jgi:Fe-Mn family superoxide dismutase
MEFENMTLESETQSTQEPAPEKRLQRREFLKMAAAVGGSALALSQLRLDAGAQQPGHGMHQMQACPMGKSCPICKGGPCPKDQPCPMCEQMKMQAMPKDHPMHPYNPTEAIVAKTFPNLASVEGISQNQLNQHIELYNGYVKKINEIEGQIHGMTPELDKMNATYSPYRELHVEQTYALNGVILHEYYFDNLGGSKAAPGEMLKRIITQEFGSWENYVNHLLAVGKSMRGWAITGYNMRDHRVHNYGLDLHNQWVPVNVIPLLVLDVYEHAYMIDFGTKRPAYLDAFMRNVNWQVVEDRLKTMIFHG